MIDLDDIDRRIVAALQAEGRLAIVDLAERVGLSATPCQRRVKRLDTAVRSGPVAPPSLPNRWQARHWASSNAFLPLAKERPLLT